MPTSSAPSGQERPRKRGRVLRFAAGLLVLLVVAGYLAYHFGGGSSGSASCTVRADGAELELTQDQAANAATIAAVATSRGLPERAVTIALATSLQESRLDNLDHGDRDSLGLFQQRPSQGWGTAQQILDPVYSTNEFFDGLVKIQGYSRLPLTVAAQRVQRSGYPQAYAKHEADATLLAAALVGRKQGALSCTTGSDKPDSAGGAPGDAAKVATTLTREFGSQARPRTDGAPRTVTVPAAAAGGTAAGEGARRGWELAQWAVAHAHELKVEQVSFGAMRWQAERSGKGWQKAAAGAGAGTGTGPSGEVPGGTSGGGTSGGASGDASGDTSAGFVRITVAR